MNDTHPTVAVAELMRILMDEEGLEWDDAWDITTRTCAYTNHTIMAEALEKWPIRLFSRLLPRIYQIVEEINRRFVLKIQSMYPGNQDKVKNMAIFMMVRLRWHILLSQVLLCKWCCSTSYKDSGRERAEGLL